MIEVYSWATPNGHKVHIMLEECGLPYRVIPIDIGAGDQFKPEFLAISPNNKIPAIVDPEGPDGQPISLFESGAILIYLAGKTGQIPARQHRATSYEVLQWLMFQMGGVGPMLGQAHHFRIYAPEKIDYAIDRYTNEARRLYGVIDRRWRTKYIGRRRIHHRRHRDLPVAALLEEPGHRLDRLPARSSAGSTRSPRVRQCSAASQVLAELRKPLTDDKARDVLFGEQQYARRSLEWLALPVAQLDRAAAF